MERVDVFVIGGGGLGGDVTGSLARAGLNVVMAERHLLGGECSHYGCDPTKAMLKAARMAASARRADAYGVRVPSVEVDVRAVMARVTRLIEEETADGARPYEEAGARVIMQEALLVAPHRVRLAEGTEIEADRIVLATGSEAAAPPVPGLQDGGYWTNKEAVWHGGGAPESLVVLGAGAIGIEFAQIYFRFGSRVTVIEADDRMLPMEDAECSEAIARALSAEGIDLRLSAKASRVDRVADVWRVTLEDGSSFDGDQLLVATGRRPSFDGHDLDAAGVRLDEEGVPILGDTLRSTAPHIWIGGDAKGFLQFTHINAYDAQVIVADILGRPFPKDYRVVPRVTYCEPEVAAVGLTEEEARGDHRVVTATIPMKDNSRAFLEGESAGLVKLVADADTGEVLGGHIVGEAAGELIHVVVAVMAGRIQPKAVGEAIHAYPTRAEAVRSAFRELAGKLG